MKSEKKNTTREVLVQQQEWDELLDRAFDAIGNSSDDLFLEQWRGFQSSILRANNEFNMSIFHLARLRHERGKNNFWLPQAAPPLSGPTPSPSPLTRSPRQDRGPGPLVASPSRGGGATGRSKTAYTSGVFAPLWNQTVRQYKHHFQFVFLPSLRLCSWRL
jgi:hypothetical protein